MSSGTVNGSHVSTVLRDTGCSCNVISSELLPDVDISKSKVVTLSDYLGRESSFSVVKCYISCLYFCGWVDAVRAPIKSCSILIGNVTGVIDPNLSIECNPDLSIPINNSTPQEIGAVTRAGKVKSIHPLVVPSCDPLNLTLL